MNIRFEYSQVATAYSTLTGVLAGFVFAGVTILLTNPPHGKGGKEVALPLFTLLVVFFCLVIASFAFATLPGHAINGSDTRARSVQASIFFLGCCVFALGGVALFMSLTWLLASYNASETAISGARLVVHGVGLIAATNLFWACGMMIRETGRGEFPKWIDALWAGLLIAPVLPVIWPQCERGFWIWFGVSDDAVTRSINMCVAGLSVFVGIVVGVLMAYPTQGLANFVCGTRFIVVPVIGLLFFGCATVLPEGSLFHDLRILFLTASRR